MNWIKNRFDQLILAVLAVALLAFAAIVLTKTGSFDDRFSEVRKAVPTTIHVGPIWDGPRGDVFPPTNPASLTDPPVLNLFGPGRYIVGKEGPIKPEDAPPIRYDSLTAQGIPNAWFLNRELPLEQGNVALQDPDKDGFTNEDEWRAGTDPRDSHSHPPYHTKLFVKQIVRAPFRLMFAAYNGDVKKLESVEFQIDTIDLRQPSAFLKMGEVIPNTSFKLEKFEPKEFWNEKIMEKGDVSELTLVNTETQDRVVLPLRKLANAPKEDVIFDYQWPPAAGSIRVKKAQQFALKPEIDKIKLYKLIDIRETEAVIQTPDELEYTVVRDPRQTAR